MVAERWLQYSSAAGSWRLGLVPGGHEPEKIVKERRPTVADVSNLCKFTCDMKILHCLALAVAFALPAVAAPEIGKPAPEFTLKDTSGKEVSLSDYKDKIVVLEWVNYGCPFVQKHYGSGNMQKLQKQAADDGIVWLSICSSAPGKQGNETPETGKAKSAEVKSAAAAYLVDEDGKVGRLYNAKTTPEMFIIDPKGTLVYMGAIDDNKSADPAVIPSSKNHVSAALDELKAGKPVSTASTKSYGCSVKYP